MLWSRHSVVLRALSAAAVAAMLVVPVPMAAEIQEGQESIRITVSNGGTRVLPLEERTRLRVFVHDTEPGHRRRQAAGCQSSVNEDSEIYALTGWHLPAGTFAFEVNPTKAPEAVRGQAASVLGAAAGAWSAVDADKQLSYAGTSATSRPRYDGHNVILWRLLSSRTLAVAYIWYDPGTGDVVDADMVFNTKARWTVNDPAAGDCGGTANTFDLQAIATHEFGHWIGLEDLYSAAATDLTMYGIATAQELKKSTLGTGDVLGAQAVFP